MANVKFKSEIFKSSKKSILYIFLFFIYICKTVIIKNIYQLNIIKKITNDWEKKLVKDMKIFLKKKRKKSDNMAVNVTKIYQEIKTKALRISSI